MSGSALDSTVLEAHRTGPLGRDADLSHGGLGVAVRRLRDERGISQRALSARASINPSHLFQVEREAAGLGWSKVCDLANALEVSVLALAQFAEADPEEAPPPPEADRTVCPSLEDLGAGIRILREERGLTIAALAEKAGVSDGALGKRERGRGGDPRWDVLRNVARGLRLPPSELVRVAEAQRGRPRYARDEWARSPRRGLGLAVRRLRIERGLTQRALEARAGIARAFLAQVEHETAGVGWSKVCDLASALGVSVLALARFAEADPEEAAPPPTADAQRSTPPTREDLGVAIRILREERGWTVGHLADLAGVNVVTLRNWERGRSDPWWSLLRNVAVGLGLSLSELVRAAEAQRGRPRPAPVKRARMPKPARAPKAALSPQRAARAGEASNVRLGAAISRLRQADGMSRHALAQAAGIDRSYIGEIEEGRRRVGWTVVCKVAHDGLRVPVARLAHESEADPATTAPVTGVPPLHPPTRVPPDASEVARVLVRLRAERGLTQEDLGGTAGLKGGTVSLIERGGRGLRWPVLCSLAEALGLTIAALVKEAEREEAAPRASG